MGSATLPTPATSFEKRQRRIRFPLSVIVGVILLLCLQFAVLPQYVKGPSESSIQLSRYQLDKLNEGLAKCADFSSLPISYEVPAPKSRTNPRRVAFEDDEIVVLGNVTLFDGEKWVEGPVDLTLSHGVIKSVLSVSQQERHSYPSNAKLIQMNGKYVTPGLVDMHSHHLVYNWPMLEATQDGNEVSPSTTGPLTPFVRSLDGMHPYDKATTIIASGGVTTSLILPGSANIMGGEAFLVKNLLNSGTNGEEVVEELLLEHGIPKKERRRYMKMACGENPARLYHHTRMGNAWIFREHMTRAKELQEKQDSWCLNAAVARENEDELKIASLVAEGGGLPEQLELDSTIAMLRGKIGINVHCYEPEDFEDMLLHSKEFGFRVQAFHHALSAWKVPEMIKEKGENITIATFAEFGLYKQEAYEANLWAGKILAEHGVPVAYKSDHVTSDTSAKYLLWQAAVGHSFHLPEELALQSVTSVPAKSLEIDHRVGYVRSGYDADVVVWDSHPLSIGATPLQVYIDGVATLDPKKVAETLPNAAIQSEVDESKQARMRVTISEEERKSVCEGIEKQHRVIINGIKESFLEQHYSEETNGNLTMVLQGGEIQCFGLYDNCVSSVENSQVINLAQGFVAPGLTAVTSTLGLVEIAGESSTSDGSLNSKVGVLDPSAVVYAKYGIHLEGRAFQRARYGGVTRAITAPVSSGGLAGGVSVGFKTKKGGTILNGGVFKDDVALHFTLGQDSKVSDSTPTVSSAIGTLRKMLQQDQGKDTLYGKAANGTIPVVVHAENKYDIMQLIKIKKEFDSVHLVLFGASESPLVAEELAEAQIPVIIAPFRGSPDTFEKRDVLAGPPLTKSSVHILSEAGVYFGLAFNSMEGDPFIHDHMAEAAWAAKFIPGITKGETIDLVSRNIEAILELEIDEKKRDFVLYEGNPLQFGSSVVLAMDGGAGGIIDCWPDVQ